MKVTVYNGSYTRQAVVGGYVSCSVTWQWLGVGTGVLALDVDHPLAPLLLRANRLVLPVVVDLAGQRWSGRVGRVERVRPRDGNGELTVTLIDDWAWLRAILARPVPAAGLDAQTSTYDTRTGPAATVACQLIDANATRLGLPIAVVYPSEDTSPTVTVEARFKPLDEYIVPILRDSGWGLSAAVWLPGDLQVGDLALDRPTVVFRAYRVASKPWLRWSDTTGVVSDTIAVQHPDAHSVTLGGSGEETDRIFEAYTDQGLAADLGAFGFPEDFADETNIDDPTNLRAQGPKHLTEVGGAVSVSIDVEDGVPWTFGEHYQVGDTPVVELDRVPIARQLSRVTATDNRADGLVITPQVGDAALTEPAAEVITRAVAQIAASVASIQSER